MLRNIKEFTGDTLIVGGGWTYKHVGDKRAEVFRKPNYCYAIDINPDAEPDAVLDITNAKQCAILPDARFSLIYFECFPFDKRETFKAFSVAHRMLKKGGILIYYGGSNIKDHSIQTLLRNAGFVDARSKTLSNEPKDNGSLSIASNVELKHIDNNPDQLSPVAQYYLNHYKFLVDEPFESKSISDEEIERELLATKSVFKTLTPISQAFFHYAYATFFNKEYTPEVASSSQIEADLIIAQPDNLFKNF